MEKENDWEERERQEDRSWKRNGHAKKDINRRQINLHKLPGDLNKMREDVDVKLSGTSETLFIQILQMCKIQTKDEKLQIKKM